MRTVSCVIPVFNNESTIQALYAGLSRTFKDRVHEVIFVDDCSGDASRAEILATGSRYAFLESNRGQSAAILRGLMMAKHDTMVVMDADLEDRPRGAGELVASLEQSQLDVLFSRRSVDLKISSVAFRTAIKALYWRLPFWSCLHFAANRRAVNRIIRVADDSDYLVAVIGTLDCKSGVLPLERGKRPTPGTGYPGFRRVRHATHLFRASIRRRFRGAR